MFVSREKLFVAVLMCAAGALAVPTVVVKLVDAGPLQVFSARESTIYRAVTTGGAGWVNFDYKLDNTVAGNVIPEALGPVTRGYSQLVFSIDGKVVCSNRIETATSGSGSLDSDYTFVPSGTHVLLWEVKAVPSSAPGEIWEGEGEDRKSVEGTVYGEAPTVTISNLGYSKSETSADADYLTVVPAECTTLNEPCQLPVGVPVYEAPYEFFSTISKSPVTLTATSLPTGLQLRQMKSGPDAGQWYLAGTPTKAGVYYTTLKAVNNNGYAHTAYLRFDIGGAQPLFVNSAGVDLQSLVAEPPYVAESFSRTFEVPPAKNGAPVSSVTVAGLPAGVKSVFRKALNGDPATVTLSGTPTATFLGTITLTVNYAAVKRKIGSKVVSVKTAATKAAGKFLVEDLGSTYVALDVDCSEDDDGNLDGTVSGGGVKRIGSTATVTAKPRDAAKTAFVGWYVRDGDDLVPCNQHDDYATVADYRKASIAFMVRYNGMPKLIARFADREEVAVGVSGGVSGSLVPSQLDALAAPDGWKLSAVKGLPAGLSYKNGKITGVSTTPGYKTITLTFTKGKTSYTRTAVIYVEPLPLWVQGTFKGGVMQETTTKGKTKSQNGLFTATVSAGGKVSGSCTVNGTKISFSGTGLSPSTSTDAKYVYRAKVSGKFGKATKTFTFDISQAQDMVAVPQPTATFRGKLSATQTIRELIIRQNLWKRGDAAEQDLPTFIGTPVCSVQTPNGYGLTFKFGANGAVTGSISGDKAPISFSGTLIDVEHEMDGHRAVLVIAVPANTKKKTKAHSYVVEFYLGGESVEVAGVDEQGKETTEYVFGVTSESIGQPQVFSYAEFEQKLNDGE